MAKWKDPGQEYVQSSERISIRALAAKWKQPERTLFEQSRRERWVEKRQQFHSALAARTEEKTAEKVAEKVSDRSSEIIARQVRNIRGAQGIGVELLTKLQTTLSQYPDLLQVGGGAWCAKCDEVMPTKCNACGTPHVGIPLNPMQLVKLYKDLVAAVSQLTKEEREALGLAAVQPGVQVNVTVERDYEITQRLIADPQAWLLVEKLVAQLEGSNK